MNHLFELKQKLLLQCVRHVEERIAVARQAMNAAQEAANSEEKSSAGDKYETGRAMAQIARDQAAQQLAEALKLKSALDQINPLNAFDKVKPGSLIITDRSAFYISVSVGELVVDGQKYFAVSPQSPIGKILLECKVNDVFTFNKQQQKVNLIQ
jgi:transcription elongation GreA/GreB family factor